ncbi:hypothetical protein KCP75_23045 [Salmonella enterica subsp. enterica]|nr:hypothetical protein KCP75_23045 [Salmonella enterica subsp. enterica]
MRDDGGINVSSIKAITGAGNVAKTEGKSVTHRYGPSRAALKVSFGPFYGGYNVIAARPGAVMRWCARRIATICGYSRTPTLSEEIKHNAGRRDPGGFDVNK